MMSYKLFLDDERMPSDCIVFMQGCSKIYEQEDWIIVRNYEAFVKTIEGYWEKDKLMPILISFDHDLGHNVPTGHDFSKWLVDMHLDGRYTFPKDFDFNVHSANPPGLANIKGLMDGFIHFLKNSE